MHIEPTFRSYLDRAIAERPIPLDQVNVKERRAQVAQSRSDVLLQKPANVTVAAQDFSFGGHAVSGLIFKRDDWQRRRPIILYMHGGGWMYGSPEQSAELAFLYAEHTGAVVISPRYRLTPEHPFPAAFQDCYAALHWANQHADQLGASSKHIILAGESAGGNLAAALSLKARDEGGPHIALQLLNYPALGLQFDSESYVKNADAPILSRNEMTYFWRNYLGERLEHQEPYSVPLLAATFDRLAPAHIVVAEHDPLRDDGIMYAQRLISAGVSVELKAVAGLTHGFFRAMSESSYVQRLAHELVHAINGLQS